MLYERLVNHCCIEMNSNQNMKDKLWRKSIIFLLYSLSSHGLFRYTLFKFKDQRRQNTVHLFRAYNWCDGFLLWCAYIRTCTDMFTCKKTNLHVHIKNMCLFLNTCKCQASFLHIHFCLLKLQTIIFF